MITLRNEQHQLYENLKICLNFGHKKTNEKNYRKVKDHCHYTGKYRSAEQSLFNLKYSVPKEIHMIFHN